MRWVSGKNLQGVEAVSLPYPEPALSCLGGVGRAELMMKQGGDTALACTMQWTSSLSDMKDVERMVNESCLIPKLLLVKLWTQKAKVPKPRQSSSPQPTSKIHFRS